MPPFVYLPAWFLKARFLGRQNPLQTVLFISDQCNLACRHCNIYSRGAPIIKSCEAVREELIYAHAQGSRFVDFEGGEPMLWRDGGRDINDLVRLAKELGFYSATVTTNAQLPFDRCAADSIWVSLDGLGRYHDLIRGAGAFERLAANIERNPHPRLSANMVINSLNHPSVKETIEFVRKHPRLKSIAINFHTPFAGTEELRLDGRIRDRLIDEIIVMKKLGYPIMNSVSGLRLMKTGASFAKRCWVTNFIMADGSRLPECQGQRDGLCDQCGFAMAGEMAAVFAFRPDTLLAGMSLRIGGK